MTICFFVPGFAGSMLSLDQAGKDVVWCDYSALALGGMRRLALSPDGVTPLPPHGRQLYPAGLYAAYYGEARATLGYQMVTDGYEVVGWPYDWRLRTRSNGELLAQRIRSATSIDDPCAIVAHSFGGVVARAAWADLVATGDQAKVRRIVTLASPHWGSYRVVQLWTGSDKSLRQLQLLSFGPVAVLPAPALLLGALPYSSAELVGLAMTWPALYELLPTIGQPDSGDDPDRLTLYTSTAWRSPTRPAAALLDESRTDFGPWLHGAASVPPAWVLTTVAADGLPTYDRLLAPRALGVLEALGQTAAGDGTVTVASALLASAANVTIPAGHMEVPLAMARDGTLRELVLQVRVAPQPPPPATVRYGPIAVGKAGPPLPADWAFVPNDP